MNWKHENYDWGGIPKIILMSPKEINFPFGFAVGAVYFKKDYKGKTEIIVLEQENSNNATQ